MLVTAKEPCSINYCLLAACVYSQLHFLTSPASLVTSEYVHQKTAMAVEGFFVWLLSHTGKYSIYKGSVQNILHEEKNLFWHLDTFHPFFPPISHGPFLLRESRKSFKKLHKSFMGLQGKYVGMSC